MPQCARLLFLKNSATYAFHMCVGYDKTKQTHSLFDLEGDLVGVPHTWYLSAQSFITLLKLVWREKDIVAMNEWKKKCVGLQRTWVSKRTVWHNDNMEIKISVNIWTNYTHVNMVAVGAHIA